MVDYNCMELKFLLGIHHVARIRRIRCHMGPPMDFLPPDKIPYDKSSPSMGFRPPLLPKQIAHAVPILHMEFVLEEICHRGGSSAMGFLPGECLPYGIISLGKSCYGISSGGRFAIWFSICYNFIGDNLPFVPLL